MHLLPYTSVLLTASALHLPLQRRNPCVDVQEYESVYDDGPTTNGEAGIGAEFETPFFKFEHKDCSIDNTNAARKAVIDSREGTNWFLSADTGLGAGKLAAEYILDGLNIKVGSGDGARAAKAVADDLVSIALTQFHVLAYCLSQISWKPWAGNGPKTVIVGKNECNPWTITAPNQNQDPKKLPWFPQITTAMPLEALYNLMNENMADSIEKNILDGTIVRFKNPIQLVTQDYFQFNDNGIDRSKVTDHVLAFCTLVLSYAKAAKDPLKPDQSPKLFIAFVPRTEFNTLYEQVKSKLPGDLFRLFNSLACYMTADNGDVS